DFAALLAVPDRDRGCKDPLPGDAPVPFHGAGPVLEPDLHVFRVPVYLVCSFQDSFMVYFYKPLGFGKNFYRSITAPAEPDILFEGLLIVEEACSFQVGNYSLPALRDAHALVLACGF